MVSSYKKIPFPQGAKCSQASIEGNAKLIDAFQRFSRGSWDDDDDNDDDDDDDKCYLSFALYF